MARRIINYKPMICTRCGTGCKRKSATQKFCEPCGYQVNLEKHRIVNRKYEASRPPRVRNSPAYLAGQKKWAQENREKRLASVRAYNDRNRETINAKARIHLAKPEVKANRREIDRKYRAQTKQRLDQRMKTSIGIALRGAKAGRSWETLVGYTVSELMRHLERQFVAGMSWDNIGEWEVDHIVPKSLFKYSTAEEADFKAAWALTNLRPLWFQDNRSKHARRTHLI